MTMAHRGAWAACLFLLAAGSTSAQAPAEAKGPPGLVVPPGMRAVAVRLGKTDAATGFILPGARVDLVAVARDGADKAVAKTVVENVLVLAVDVTQPPADKPAEMVTTLTVALTPADALKLSQATEKREIRALLRPPEKK